ncbi:MAG: TetR/AcrR family transcriptional regulator [Rhizobiaceae bacterium]|nr:TetR/AcrR family transcriptional regulator [Rhizobiaceae bacterium]
MIKRDSPERRGEILAATLKVLRAHGVAGASTAKIAAEANCSKETIYSWFGDRDGLLSCLVEKQVYASTQMLKAAIENSPDPRQGMVNAAAILLDLLTGEASLLINRVVIGQVRSGDENLPGKMLLGQGYGEISNLICELLERARSEGVLNFEDANEAYSTFFGLIIGERQIKALLGEVTSRPQGGQMMVIAGLAVERMIAIYNN